MKNNLKRSHANADIRQICGNFLGTCAKHQINQRGYAYYSVAVAENL